MAQYFSVHPENPQQRLLKQAVALLAKGGIVAVPTDSSYALVCHLDDKAAADKLRQIGMKVEVQDMDWATLTQRRANRGALAQGGWSMFHTWWLASDVMDPSAIAYSGDRENGWYGWPKDDALEKLRSTYNQAVTQDEKKAIAAKVQQCLVDIGAVGILGQFFEPVAYRGTVEGITSPIQFYWNMSVALPWWQQLARQFHSSQQ